MPSGDRLPNTPNPMEGKTKKQGNRSQGMNMNYGPSCACQPVLDFFYRIQTFVFGGAGFKIKAFCIAFAYGSRRQGLFIF